MNNLRRLTFLLAALAALSSAAPAPAATPNAPNIQITRNGFTPASITIKAGGSVNWVNNDTVDHTISSPAANLANTLLHPTDNFGFTFPSPGSFTVADAQNAAVRMTVVVEAAAIVTVHLSIVPKALVAGQSATLRGSISTQESGQQVRVEAQPCGSSAFGGLKTIATGGGGAFSLRVKPNTNTTYRVRFGDGTATVGAQVSPRLTLRKTGARTFVVTLRGANGKLVSVQAKPPGKGWRPSGRARVRGNTASFVLQTPSGTLVRASIDPKQAGACLATAVSNVVRA